MIEGLKGSAVGDTSAPEQLLSCRRPSIRLPFSSCVAARTLFIGGKIVAPVHYLSPE